MVVGGPLVAEDKDRADAVSDSEDDDEQLDDLGSDAARYGLPDTAEVCRTCAMSLLDSVGCSMQHA